MLDQVVFEEPWRGIKVVAYTDRHAYDPDDDSLIFMSLAGTEQAVKAISSAIIGYRTVSIKAEGKKAIQVSGNSAAHVRVFSTKLPTGALHQVLVDTRFLDGNDTRGRLAVCPQEKDLCAVVYSQVLAPLASPLIPEWSPWICGQLKTRGLMRDMAGTMRVVEVHVDEATVDAIISEGVRARRISLKGKGPRHVGFH